MALSAPTSLPSGANEYQSNVSSLANAGTGVFNQTGGSVGAIGGVSGVTGGNQAVGLTVGGDWIYNPASILKTTGGTNWTSVGTYNLSDPNHNDLTGTGPLVVGGIEGVGVSGTGTFNQSGGTNVLAGGGNLAAGLASIYGDPHERQHRRTSCSAGLATKPMSGGNQGLQQLLRRRARGVQPQWRTLDQFDERMTENYAAYYASGIEIVGLNGTGTFTQSGGSNIVGYSLSVGGAGGGVSGFISNADVAIFPNPTNLTHPGFGTYTLSGGLLQAIYSNSNSPGSDTGGENVGEHGNGTFIQTVNQHYPTNLPRWG